MSTTDKLLLLTCAVSSVSMVLVTCLIISCPLLSNASMHKSGGRGVGGCIHGILRYSSGLLKLISTIASMQVNHLTSIIFCLAHVYLM